jgi:hypothetical protein
MSAMQELARIFGVKLDAVDDVLRSERGYRAAISRRSLFAAGAALAVGRVLSGGPIPLYVFTNDSEWVTGRNLDDAYGHLESYSGIPREDYEHDECPLEQLPHSAIISILSFADGAIAGHDDDYDLVAHRTAAEWIRRNGEGFLCTSEH